MLEFLGTALVSMIEKELIKHEPEIKDMILDQLNKLSIIISEFVSAKLDESAQSIAALDKPKDTPN
jgi:hypothetical protein